MIYPCRSNHATGYKPFAFFLGHANNYFLCYRYKRFHAMTLKYTDKVQICRQKELDEYKQILNILEDSRQLVMDCDNLVKIRALKTRCEKISRPRETIKTDATREGKRKNYHDNKEKYLSRKQDKRQKIREMNQVDLGAFYSITT